MIGKMNLNDYPWLYVVVQLWLNGCKISVTILLPGSKRAYLAFKMGLPGDQTGVNLRQKIYIMNERNTQDIR